MSNINLEELTKRTDELFSLIDDTNRALNMPVSHVREDYAKSFSKAAPRLGAEFQKVISKGRIEEAVIGGVILGAGYVGAAAFDAAKNGLAKKKAQEKLAGYYKELASKQNMLIKAQKEQQDKMNKANKQMNADAQQYKKKFDELSAILYRLQRFKSQVES